MRGSFGLGGLRLFQLNCANMAFGLFGCSPQKKIITKCLFDIL